MQVKGKYIELQSSAYKRELILLLIFDEGRSSWWRGVSLTVETMLFERSLKPTNLKDSKTEGTSVSNALEIGFGRNSLLKEGYHRGAGGVTL